MMYYAWPPKWWQDMMKNAGEFTSETLGGGFGEIAGELGNSVLDEALNVLPEQLAQSLRAGVAKAGLEDMLKKAFNPVEALQAKIALNFIEQFKKFGEEVSKSWNKVDQSAFDFGKQVGLSQRQVENLRESIINLGSSVEGFGAKYGKTLDELIKMQSDFATQIGRTIRLTNEQYEDLAALSGIVGDEMAVKFAAQLESFGMSTTATNEMMTKMYNESLKKGITLQAYSKNVSENLHLAQQYTFKDGVNGLMKMAENAAKMKMDMQQVVSLGNKLAEGGVESAVNMAAELQVLGGAFAQFADPLGLLHDSLLDMDGLSDRLTGLVGKMGRFDKEQGKVIIDPFQQIQLRQAAKSMGLDYGKLIDSATQQAKRKEIETQMMGLSNIPKEYKELIMNTAQFKNGRAGVTLANGEFKELNKLTHGELVEIADLEKDVADDVKEIKKHLIGAEEVRQNTQKELDNQNTIQFRNQSEAIKGIYTEVSTQTKTLQQIAQWQMISSTLSTAGGVFNSFLPVLRPILKMVGLKFANGGMIKTHSDGDLITNGTPGREYILNSAQYGEFIVNAESAKHHLGLLRAINADKNGNIRIKQYDGGGMIENGMMSGMSGFSGMGVMGYMYQLQMINNIQGSYQHYVDGITGRFSKTQGLINARNTELNKIIENAKKEQQRLLNERRNTILTKRGELQNKIDLRNTEKEISNARKALESNTKHQQTLNNTMVKSEASRAKIAKIGKIGMGVAGSAMAGLSGYMSTKSYYESTGEAIMNKQKAKAGTVGATIGATAGAALGSIAGPIGMMIGSSIGQSIGQAIGEKVGTESKSSMNATRIRLAKNMTNGEGSNKFYAMKGDFSTKEQEVIAKALEDGKLFRSEIKDKDLITKLEQTGNANIFETHGRGGWLRGKPHTSGGIYMGSWNGKQHFGEGDEALISADKAKQSPTLINGIMNGKYNDMSIKPIEPMGKQMHVNEKLAQNNLNQPLNIPPINININGTIKLDTNDKTFDISKAIFNDSTFITKITDIITKQLNINEHFSLNRKQMRNKYSTL